MTALHELSITEAGRLLRKGDLSPVELTRACLDRIAAVDGRLHAFITVTGEVALAQARTAETELAAGRDRGPLHGIPIAHKDIVCTRGIRTTAHSNLLRDWVPEADAGVHTRLMQAGAVLVGKLSLWEFAYGNPGPTVAFPPARNPWHIDYSPGGSSSGSGTAVAAGMCLGATGTDTGGSIRHPATVCGIVGMKPTFGRVSVRGVLPLAPSLDHVGPMTRTVRDNALMLQAMAGHDPGDPISAAVPVPDFSALIGQPLAGLRLGVPRAFMAATAHEPECLAAFEEALRVLRGLGASTVDFDFPVLAPAADLGTRIIVSEAYPYHALHLAMSPHKYDVSLRARLASLPSPAALAEAHATRATLKHEYAMLFGGGVDAIVSVGREGEGGTMASLAGDPTGKRGGCTRMYNMAGLPALVLPMGFGARGLPLSLQIAADRWREDRVYQIAAAYEDAAGWTARRPPV